MVSLLSYKPVLYRSWLVHIFLLYFLTQTITIAELSVKTVSEETVKDWNGQEEYIVGNDKNEGSDESSSEESFDSTSMQETVPQNDGDQPRNGDGKTGLIIGLVVGVFLLLLLLAVLFVYRKNLLRSCFYNSDLPTHPSYIPETQETSQPENSETTSTVSLDFGNRQIREEFKELSTYTPEITSRIAITEKNAKENRYRDVIPYDFNIVSLKSGHYVNASHIESSFIVTQDPIMAHEDDIWQVVWEHNVSIIVRLSNDHDDRTLPCAVYIPRERWVVGNLDITNVNQRRMRNNFSRRIIRLNDTSLLLKNKVREIYHYHIECWEHKSLPPVRDFMLALQDIRKQKKTFDTMGFTRTLIHCGSGSGRTGAFIAIWLLLDSVDAGDTDISVFKMVRRLREQRAHVVNTLELYKFIHECLEFYRSNVNLPRSDSLYETVVGVGNSGGSEAASQSTTLTRH